MKKIISCLVSLVIALSAIGTAGTSAFASETESELRFNATFTDESDVSKFTLVGKGDMAAIPSVVHNADTGTMDFTAWGSMAALMLPENVNEKNYVMEAEYQYSLTDEYDNSAIWLGFVFGFEDEKNNSNIRYRVSDGTVNMVNINNGISNSRYAEKGNGASTITPENQKLKLKLIINEGKMEFFVNGELSYTYYSPDDSRIGTDNKTNTAANNFAKGGRVGLCASGKGARISVDGVRVRTVGSDDIAFHSDSHNDPNMPLDFLTLNSLDNYFTVNTFNKGNWGEGTWQAVAYSTIGQYSKTPVSGNYTVDLNFAYNRPANSSRYIGIVFGVQDNDDGSLSYNVASVRVDGSQYIEQHIIKNGVDTKIETSASSYGDCRKVLPQDKRNPGYDGVNDAYFINYHEENEVEPTDAVELAKYKIARRNTMRLSVVDGVASLSFGGSTITCDIDANSTDGYVGIISAGSAAKVYSFRSAPYYVDKPIEDIKTTMSFDYIDISKDYTDADIIIDDQLNVIDENTWLIVAAYKDEVLLGASLETAMNGLNMPSIEYDEVENTDGIILRAYLWDGRTQSPIINSVEYK